MSDYTLPGLHGSVLGTAIAGALGTVIVFGLAWLLARALVPRTQTDGAGSPRPTP